MNSVSDGLPRATRKIWDEINGAICCVKCRYNISQFYNVTISQYLKDLNLIYDVYICIYLERGA